MPSSRDDGFTLIELLIVIGITAVVTALAAAGLLRAKAAANETAAIASLSVTSSSERAYAIACGRGGYAASYMVLGMAPPGGGPAFISEDMGSVLHPMKAGYRFALAAGAGSTAGPADCNGGPTVTAFHATAVPLSIVSGSRAFAVNANGAIWQQPGGRAPAEPFGPPARLIQ